MAKVDESTLVQMGREYPDMGAGAVVERLRDIATLAKRHESLCVRYCNEGDFNPKRIENAEKRIADLLKIMFPGTGFIAQRDPRGATIKLNPPSGATNDWGREGLCVLA